MNFWNKFTFKVAITSVKFTFYPQSFHYCRIALRLHSSKCNSKSLQTENTSSLVFARHRKMMKKTEKNWKSKECGSGIISIMLNSWVNYAQCWHIACDMPWIYWIKIINTVICTSYATNPWEHGTEAIYSTRLVCITHTLTRNGGNVQVGNFI